MDARKHRKYGRGQHVISADEALYDPAALVARLRSTLNSASYKPPLLPAVAMEVYSLTQDPDVRLGRVRSLLEQDPVLAAGVLRVAQSPLYSRGATIYSLDDAIGRLGLRTLGDLFLSTALSSKVFRARGFERPMEELRTHSTVTAYLARLICRSTGLPDEYAFLCGLLHDVGSAAGMLILADGGGRPGRGLPAVSEVMPALLAVHEEAAGVLAQAWQLPADVKLVISSHHHFEIGERVHPLAAAVCMADWMAVRCGAGSGDEVNDAGAQRAARALGLERSQLEKMLRQGEALVEQHAPQSGAPSAHQGAKRETASGAGSN